MTQPPSTLTVFELKVTSWPPSKPFQLDPLIIARQLLTPGNAPTEIEVYEAGFDFSETKQIKRTAIPIANGELAFWHKNGAEIPVPDEMNGGTRSYGTLIAIVRDNDSASRIAEAVQGTADVLRRSGFEVEITATNTYPAAYADEKYLTFNDEVPIEDDLNKVSKERGYLGF